MKMTVAHFVRRRARVRAAERGVALVITLILLAVITFMTVAFLVISRAERGAVTTTTDQALAQLAADTALERFKAQVLAPFVANTNVYSQFDAYGLVVSTNYVQRAGFISGLSDFRNVNYEHVFGNPSQPLSGADRLQNLTNLFYDPRPPVFITNRAAANAMDFRFYLDLNRNGRYDTNGLLPLIGPNPGLPFISSNGLYTAAPVGVLSNNFVGDPEWIGGLEFPDRAHSADNPFLYRYAYIAVPVGRTLDLNHIHNYARQLSLPTMTAGDGFLRNQGVGTWELNLAGFLVDLNTNFWPYPVGTPFGAAYFYNLDLTRPNTGAAFDDACALLRWRYQYPPISWDRPQRWSVEDLFGPVGAQAFRVDGIDGYSHGPLMTQPNWVGTGGIDSDNPAKGWPGAFDANHFYSAQELFDPRKATVGVSPLSLNFVSRMQMASTNNDSYNRYTYYRMLSQLGADSAAENPGKLNINYVNIGGLSETNFIPWSEAIIGGRPAAEIFFTNAVDKLLKQAGFSFGVNAIPVYTNGWNVYPASVHRLLQVAANIYESTKGTNMANPFLPTIFRPQFRADPATHSLTIMDFKEVKETAEQVFQQFPLRDLDSEGSAGVDNVGVNDLVIGVPLVVAAKKGFPNFNEFTMQSFFQLTRKLQLARPSPSSLPNATNFMYVLNVTNAFGIEAWNSYRTNYTRPVEILATNIGSWYFTMVGQGGAINRIALPRFAMGASVPFPNLTNTVWPGIQSELNIDPRSFITPLTSIQPFIPSSIYRWGNNSLIQSNIFSTFERTPGEIPQPKFYLNLTNRVVFLIVDRATRRLLDYVHLGGLTNNINLSDALAGAQADQGLPNMWSTNLTSQGYPEGVVNQIVFSMNPAAASADWRAFGPDNPADSSTKRMEINKFTAFCAKQGTNTSIQVPFTPTGRVQQSLSWQANDPLVHYTKDDLLYLPGSEVQVKKYSDRIELLPNLGLVNNRYSPWGGSHMHTGSESGGNTGDPNATNFAVKDPGVRSSDFWEFPTNKFPNVGWLGRVHRGTPWQTVFLKSTNILAAGAIGQKTWREWTGNSDAIDALRTAPVEDRKLLEVFTAAINDSATRGQLSINQPGLAAWSAVFSGLVTLQGDPSASLLQPPTNLTWSVIEPAGAKAGTNSPLWRLVTAINEVRERDYGGAFKYLGDILSVPQLTEYSPFLAATNVNVDSLRAYGLPDTVYEWLPQQTLGLLTVESAPRYLVFSYGQALKPADKSIVVNGPSQYFGLCTNYQITAEVATRALVRLVKKVDDPNANPPKYHWETVTESFNVLPPD